MKIRMLLGSGLAASVVMLAAGAAFSGGPATTTDNRLVDFVQSTGELTGVVAGGNALTYLHNAETQHLLANLTSFLPPDPCIPLAEAWNATVNYDTRFGVRSTFVFDVLLTFMADLQCRATVTSTTGTTRPIVVIAPTAK